MFPVEDLISFVRLGVDDNDSEDYEYPQSHIIRTLIYAIQVVESGWEQEDSKYKIVTEGEGDDIKYFISPFPPIWKQMLYTLKAIIMLKTFEVEYGIRTPMMTISKSDKVDSLKEIKKMYESIEEEHRYNVAAEIYTTWDDFLERYDKINLKIG